MLLQLTERERKVWHTLSRIPMSVAVLSRRSGLSRTTIFSVLLRLHRRGLVSPQQVGRRRLWQKVPLGDRLRSLDALQKVLVGVSSSRASTGLEDRIVTIHRGKAALLNIVSDMMSGSLGPWIRGIQSDVSSVVAQRYFDEQSLIEGHLKLKKRRITVYSIVSRGLVERMKTERRQSVLKSFEGRTAGTVVLPDEMLSLRCDLYITRDRAYLHSWSDLISVELRDLHVVELLRVLFDLIYAIGNTIDINALAREVLSTLSKDTRVQGH
jgi:predicted transcriptional regulator